MRLTEIENFKPIFKKAQNISLNSNHHAARVGAIIMVKGCQISRACNQKDKTHPYLKKFGFFYNQSLHAEMVAIFKVKNKELLKGATMVVYRETKNGHLAMSKPCAICHRLIKEYGFKKIIYSTAEGFVEENI